MYLRLSRNQPLTCAIIFTWMYINCNRTTNITYWKVEYL